MSTYYGGCYVGSVTREKPLPSPAAFLMSEEQTNDRTNHYDDTCRRCMKGIALGVICQRTERAYDRCNEQRSSGCEFVSLLDVVQVLRYCDRGILRRVVLSDPNNDDGR
jgi:hypothetical protein